MLRRSYMQKQNKKSLKKLILIATAFLHPKKQHAFGACLDAFLPTCVPENQNEMPSSCLRQTRGF